MIAAVPTVFSRQLLSVTLHIYGQSTVKSRLFRRIFAVILTDNGSEFKHTRKLETTEVCKKRTKVFYCEPQASRQKPQIEKNCEFIRYVLPKGKTLNPYTQEDITVLMNNINSIRRESPGNKSLSEATADKSIFRLMELMGLRGSCRFI